MTTSSSVNPRAGLIGGWGDPGGRAECRGCCRGWGCRRRVARRGWGLWPGTPWAPGAPGAPAGPLVDSGPGRPVPVRAPAEREHVVHHVDALGAAALLPADGEMHLAHALLDLLDQLLHLGLGEGGEGPERLEPRGTRGSGRKSGGATLVLLLQLGKAARAGESRQRARDPAVATAPEQRRQSGGAVLARRDVEQGLEELVGGDLGGARGEDLRLPGVGLPALGAEVAGDLPVVVVEALVVELLLDVGHLRAGEHGGDGEPLGVGVAGHRAGVEIEDRHERKPEDRQGHHHLEEGEAAPHDFGTSGSPSTMEVFPVSGETSRVQTFLPCRTVI